MISKKINQKLATLQGSALDVLEEIMTNQRSSPGARIKAANSVLSRGGHPELRATISKSVGSDAIDIEELLAQRKSVMAASEEAQKAIANAKITLGATDEED